MPNYKIPSKEVMREDYAKYSKRDLEMFLKGCVYMRDLYAQRVDIINETLGRGSFLTLRPSSINSLLTNNTIPFDYKARQFKDTYEDDDSILNGNK